MTTVRDRTKPVSDLEFEIDGTIISLEMSVENLAAKVRNRLDSVQKTIDKGELLQLNELGELQGLSHQYDIQVAKLALLATLRKNKDTK